MFRKHDAFWVTLVKLAQYIRDLFPHKEFVGPILSSSNIKGTRDLYKSSRCIHPSCIVIIITFRRGDLVGPPPPPIYVSSLKVGTRFRQVQRAGGRSTRRIPTPARGRAVNEEDRYASKQGDQGSLLQLTTTQSSPVKAISSSLILILNVHGRMLLHLS